jgi:hypothetical protein
LAASSTNTNGPPKSPGHSQPHKPGTPHRGVHTSVQALETDIKDWIATWNDNPRPFTWTKTADESLNSLADYLAKLSTDRPLNEQN